MHTTTDLRDKVLEYVHSADGKLLRMMRALAESYQPEEAVVPEWFYKQLDKDREKHLQGEIPSSTWEEVKDRLKSQYDL